MNVVFKNGLMDKGKKMAIPDGVSGIVKVMHDGKSYSFDASKVSKDVVFRTDKDGKK